MTERFLPYARQSVSEEDIEAVSEVLRGDWLTTGPKVTEFEAALTEVTDASHAVAVSSGTAALHAAYAAGGLGCGDEIVTSPLTFAATANAALMLGAKVNFADVDPETGLIDPVSAEAAVTERTRMLVGVDYAGQPADYVALREVADRHGLRLVADAAHSLGGRAHGQRVGVLADATTLSFHPVKPITTGEGGAVVTNDPDWARGASEFRNHGLVRDPERLERKDGPWHQELHTLGNNYRLTDLHAALGTSQLGKLDGWIARRREIASAYDAGLAGVDTLRLPVERPGIESGWHIYVVRVAGDPELRRPLFDELRRRGLGVQVHYLPVHHHPLYRRLGHDPAACPNAVDYYSRAISIPLFPTMTDDDVQWVIRNVTEAAETVL